MNKHRLILIIVTCIICLLRFDYIYRDSIQYIWYTEFFAGSEISLIPDATVVDNFTVRAPYLYRPLLPMAVYLISGGNNISFMFSLLNVILLFVLSNWIYELCNLITKNRNRALMATLIATVSYPLAYYGPVPLMDTAVMLLFVFIIMCAEMNYGDEAAAFTLLIGVFIKEAILLLGLYYVIRCGWKSIWIFVPSVIGYLSIRFLFGSVNTLVFTLNIFERPIQVLGMLGLTFTIPVLLIIYYFLRGRKGTERGKKILIAGLLSSLPLVFLGLFFAYFDGRFIWPMLIVLVIYITSMGD